jgi:hypothetical protein
MADVERASAPEENRYHTYAGNSIPWWVRVLWICFWTFTIYYVINFLLPAIQSEILSPP